MDKQPNTISAQDTLQRRHDVDWLRSIALSLLIIYHIVISFQPWAKDTFFIQNGETMLWLWIPMSLLNVWRIPLLFLISGMGLRFAMERRDWIQLLKDRSLRILLPLVFGFFFICPISVYLVQLHNGEPATYTPNAGHLWFLINIYLYVIMFLALFIYLKSQPENSLFRSLDNLFKWPPWLFLICLPIVAEAWLTNPQYYSMYVNSSHGFWLGMLWFSIGFLLISVHKTFWPAVARIRHLALAIAIVLFLIRLLVFQLQGFPKPIIGIESVCWIHAVLGYSSVLLNRPSNLLSYCNKAVYPVYILHLPVQFALSAWLLPQSIHAGLKLLLLILGTFSVSVLIYEFILRRMTWIRPLFGMKFNIGTTRPKSP